MSDGLLRSHSAPRVTWLQLWPVAAFFLAQGFATVWWARGIAADVEALQKDTVEVQEAIRTIPDMKATLKNVERIVERLDAARFEDQIKRNR